MLCHTLIVLVVTIGIVLRFFVVFHSKHVTDHMGDSARGQMWLVYVRVLTHADGLH